MEKHTTFANYILQFNQYLAKIQIEVPENFKVLNPFNSSNQEQIKKISTLFYEKYYNDNNKRFMILGSSPARRGTAVTGVPYEDAQHLQQETGVSIDNFQINKASSNFLYDVIDKYGGSSKFYSKFYMNFVCPLGIVRKTKKESYVNCNYYEFKNLKDSLYNFIVESLKKQLAFNIDTSVCYCIGSGENYKFLIELNEKYKFFNSIIPLEHPRFIMQYNSKNKDHFFNKYLEALNIDKNNMNKEI